MIPLRHTPLPSQCRTLFLAALMILAASAAMAQPGANHDSLALARAAWHVDTMRGFVLKQVHFAHQEYMQSNQMISIIEIPKGSPVRLRLAYEPRRTATSLQAQRHHALAAVNATYFDMENHNPICYLRIHGLEVGENTPGLDTVNRKYYQYATLLLSADGPHLLLPDSNRRWERTVKGRDLVTAGPMLLFQGQYVPQRRDRTFATSRHNRTALGIKADGTVLLITVDGRTAESRGLSLFELQRPMRYLGCTEAINFDGGGSTTMYVRGKGERGIVNYPSDNNRFDRQGERPVSSILMIVQ